MGRTLYGPPLHHPWTHIMILERPWPCHWASGRARTGDESSLTRFPTQTTWTTSSWLTQWHVAPLWTVILLGSLWRQSEG